MGALLRHRKTGTATSLLSSLAADVQVGITAVHSAHRRHGEGLRRQQKSAEAHMRRQGIPLLVGVRSAAERWDDPNNPVKRSADAASVLCEAIATTSGDFRACPSDPELCLAARPRSPRASEALLFERSAKRLVTLQLHLMMDPKETKAFLRRLRRSPLEIRTFALWGQELHQSGKCVCRGRASCAILAVSRALAVVMEGVDSPVSKALRVLSERLFHVSCVLNAAGRRLKNDPRAGHIALLAKRAEGLDIEIRKHLRSAIDQAPRGSRPRQGQLCDASRYLQAGNSSDAQIAYLLPDRLGGDAVQRVRNRLNDLAKEDPEQWWMGFLDPVVPKPPHAPKHPPKRAA
jgi:hypothetical protein